MTFLGLSLEAWNVIGTWFSALATTTLAAVALWLATRDKRPMLEVSAGRIMIVKDTVGGLYAVERALAEESGLERESAVEVQVTNVGHRPVVVTGIYWRVPWVFRRSTIKAAIGPDSAFQSPHECDALAAFGWPGGTPDSLRKGLHQDEQRRMGRAGSWSEMEMGCDAIHESRRRHYRRKAG